MPNRITAPRGVLRIEAFLLSLVLLATALDSLTTAYIIQTGIGVESNPLARAVFDSLGMTVGHLVLSGATFLSVFLGWLILPYPYRIVIPVVGLLVWKFPIGNIQYALTEMGVPFL